MKKINLDFSGRAARRLDRSGLSENGNGVHMRVEFTYEFDDLREAIRADQRYQLQLRLQERKRHARKPGSRLLGAAAIAGLSVILFALQWMTRPEGLLGPVQHLWLKLLGPWLALAITLGVAVVIVRQREYRGLRVRRTSQERRQDWKFLGLFTLIAALVMLVLLMWRNLTVMIQRPASGAGPQDGLGADVVVVFVPWAGIAVAAWSLTWWAVRGTSTLRKTWEGSPTLLRKKTLEVDAAGLVMSDALSRGEYQWLAFTGFYESANLFLLYLGKLKFKIIPKRALDAKQMEDLRELITSRIQIEPPKGFEVLQARTA